MVPAPDALSRGWASWVRWNADSRLVLIINLYSSGVMATIGFTNPVPALLTYTTSTTSSQAAQSRVEIFLLLTRILSFPPKVDLTSSISFSRSAREETSQMEPVTLKFFAPHSFKHLWSSASFREQVWMAAPNLASSSTMACLEGGQQSSVHGGRSRTRNPAAAREM